MDHALGQARKAEGKLESAEKAHANSEKRLKDTYSTKPRWKNLTKISTGLGH